MSCLFPGEYHVVHSGNESRGAADAAVGSPTRVPTLIVSKVNDIWKLWSWHLDIFVRNYQYISTLKSRILLHLWVWCLCKHTGFCFATTDDSSQSDEDNCTGWGVIVIMFCRKTWNYIVGVNSWYTNQTYLHSRNRNWPSRYTAPRRHIYITYRHIKLSLCITLFS